MTDLSCGIHQVSECNKECNLPSLFFFISPQLTVDRKNAGNLGNVQGSLV